MSSQSPNRNNFESNKETKKIKNDKECTKYQNEKSLMNLAKHQHI